LQGPVLSGHKKLVVAKLAEEDVERKVKGEAKKEKRLVSHEFVLSLNEFSLIYCHGIQLILS